MDQRIAETIVRIVLQEIYKDGKVEAYERETLKRVLDKVGIDNKVFRKIHKEVSISAKKMKIVAEPLNHRVLLERLNQRLRMEVTPKVCKEIIDLFKKEFAIESDPGYVPKLTILSTQDIVLDKVESEPKIKSDRQDLNMLCEQSPNFPLACYLLGNGSLLWVLFFSMIPVLLNFNIGDVITEYKHLTFSTQIVKGHVIGSGYARMQGLESETTEVHYRYVLNYKNFTGYSYLTDFYPKSDHPLTIAVSKDNPKISRIIGGSYSENSTIIFIPLLLFIASFIFGVIKSIYARQTNISELSMLEDSKVNIVSHFLIRRLSIITIVFALCWFAYLPDLIFNILLPILSVVFGLGLVIVIIWASSEDK